MIYGMDFLYPNVKEATIHHLLYFLLDTLKINVNKDEDNEEEIPESPKEF